MTDHDAPAGEDYGLSMRLDLNLDRHPITGRLRTPEGTEQLFVGWLGFLDAPKQVHAVAGSQDATEDGRPRRRTPQMNNTADEQQGERYAR